MTADEVRDWCLGNGFRAMPDGRLRCDWDGLAVEMEFLPRNIRVSLTNGVQTRRLASGPPNHARVNEHGVLDGLGLGASLATSLQARGLPSPPWHPAAYRGWAGPPDPEAEAPARAP